MLAIPDGVLGGLNSKFCIVQDDQFSLWVRTGRGGSAARAEQSSSSYRGRSVKGVGKHIQWPSIVSLNTKTLYSIFEYKDYLYSLML
jgi:hypothetical protein